MDAYRKTYHHAMYPIPGEPLWEKSEGNRPLAPPVKRKPGCLQKKRRKDKDEGTSRTKKQNDQTKMNRKYREFSCAYCGKKGHTKRSCLHRKNDDAECAAIAAAADDVAKNAEGANQNQQNEVGGSQTTTAAATEVDLTPPNFSQPMPTEEEPSEELAGRATRPDKLPLKRIATQPQPAPTMDPLQGASAGTARRMSDIIKLIPTPGFKPPRKK
ncbi:hypothetical protein PIB30_020292 [Stylosanthes scabra]|uniref:CCHC-type domain-containing protein n=1 Tax=Stylosanthes scabra TaxID=79078 RepID=A0ABU6V6L3_9FABA|nr:hypothetical protein [Stylosanthes scabra]